MLQVLFFFIAFIWFCLFVAWAVYAVKAHKEEKLCSFSDKAIKYNIMMSKFAMWQCIAAMTLNILNIFIRLQ